MPESIVEISQMTDALRNTGYKNLESAVAEIVDNSIEANASEILIVLTESSTIGPKKRIKDIAIMDNGSGMNTKILNRSLGLGATTRADRKSMGRFGVGLPQASLYATTHVEVYSWQEGIDSSEMVYLDVNQIKTGQQTEIADPLQVKIPSFYRSLINLNLGNKKFDFSKSGTLVIWKDCDRLNPKTGTAIMRRFQRELGKKFRHYIHDKKCEICVLVISEETGKIESTKTIEPNDPLLLMTDNVVLGKEKAPTKVFHSDDPEAEPIFEPFKTEGYPDSYPDGKIIKTIEYIDTDGNKKSGEVTVQFSIVKEKFYNKAAIPTNPGSTDIGKAVKDNSGISIIRHGREIDFGDFDYYSNVNNPNDRWWGCEISFEPALDEVFGVSNNKQQVELIRTDDSSETFEDENVDPLWNQLHFVSEIISDMQNTNELIRKGSRTKPSGDNVDGPDNNPQPTTTQTIVNETENENDDVDGVDAPPRTPEEAIELIEEYEHNPNPSDELIDFWTKQRIQFNYLADGETNPPFDFSIKAGLAIVDINIQNPFYELFMKPLEGLDESAKTAFELMLASYATALVKLASYQHEQDLKLTKRWRINLDEYIEKLKG